MELVLTYRGIEGAMHDCAQVAEVMAKVAKQVRDAQEEAERRAPILEALKELESMRTECAWLASYETDDSRFKVCASHKACRSLSGTLPRGCCPLAGPPSGRALSYIHIRYQEDKVYCSEQVVGIQGRDANRNLQRSLKAGKVRDRLPAAVQQLIEAVAEWQDDRGQPLIYDERPLQVWLYQVLVIGHHLVCSNRPDGLCRQAKG